MLEQVHNAARHADWARQNLPRMQVDSNLPEGQKRSDEQGRTQPSWEVQRYSLLDFTLDGETAERWTLA